ncbi:MULTISPECIES: fimbrial protein [Enterobacter]|uniref:fimbrial protein n=1 Tax=Enterobacter TaxID=547 RepID=UPI0018763D43|nr:MULTISPECIES: fimbrial protein [Enterobacter]MBE4966925.1 fimbrial protein [Enterobacter cloacae complex sp. P24RS]MDH1128459.1 fimbrial protein [Enterobacter sp. GD03975]
MKIKNVALAIAAAGLLLSSQSVLASNDSGVNTNLDTGAGTQSTGGVINFTGKITLISCDITPASKNKTVDLGAWAKNYFDEHVETTPREFKINVENCPPAVESVAVLFDGNKDAQDDTLLQVTPGTGMATGVGVKLYNSDRSTSIKPGTVSKTTAPDGEGNAELTFYAALDKDGAEINAGDVNAVSNFLMVYN